MHTLLDIVFAPTEVVIVLAHNCETWRHENMKTSDTIDREKPLPDARCG